METRQLLNEMTKKYVEAARANTEASKKMEVLKEMQETLKSKLEEKESEKEILTKEFEVMKTTVTSRDEEIDRLSKEIKEKSNCSETNNLKTRLDEKDKEMKRIEVTFRENFKACAQDAKKKDHMLIEAHSRIQYLSQKANEWYHAYRGIHDKMQMVCMNQENSKSVENDKLSKCYSNFKNLSVLFQLI